jgi:hypothetical protein
VVTRRRFPLIGALALAAAVILAAQRSANARAPAPAAPSAEYRIKAAFLFNFVQFVEWPPSAFASEQAPLVICVLGNDPFGSTLDQIVDGESIATHPLTVRRPGREESLDSCGLLYVGSSEKDRLDEILRAVGDSAAVLTVSDIDGFVGRGGAIGFFLDRDRVRFEISPSRAQRHGLKLSSQLLSLGRIRSVPQEVPR